MKVLYIFLGVLFFSCKSENKNDAPIFELNKQLEAITLLNDSVYSPKLEENISFKNYEKAKSAFEKGIEIATRNNESFALRELRSAYEEFTMDY